MYTQWLLPKYPEQCLRYFGRSNVQSMTEQFSIYFWQSVKVFIVGLFNSFHLSRSVKFCKTPFSFANCHSIISNRGGLIPIPSDSVATKHNYASLIWIYLWWFGLWLIYLSKTHCPNFQGVPDNQIIESIVLCPPGTRSPIREDQGPMCGFINRSYRPITLGLSQKRVWMDRVHVHNNVAHTTISEKRVPGYQYG